MNRRSIRLATALAGAAATAVVLAGTSGATHIGPLQLGHPNTSTDPTTLTANLAAPVLKVVNQGSASALRGDAQNGIGVTGVSVTGTGQSGESQSGIGLLGTHKSESGISPGVQGTTPSTNPLAAGVVGRNTGGGPGLRSIVNAGAPPLAVNSNVKVASLNSDLLDGLDSTGLPYWKSGGNAGTNPGTDFLGTSDNTALELKVNGQRALRIEPGSSSPNLIGGSSANSVSSGFDGATIAGGGSSFSPNLAGNFYATIGGGTGNTASGYASTVSGGYGNTAIAIYSTVAGGYASTVSGYASTVSGGYGNTASSTSDTVAGGEANTASGSSSTVAGGNHNTASGGASTVGGGSGNTASGNYSFAAGLQAKATKVGSFVWGDNTLTDLTSPAASTFTVRASGGIWLGTTSSPSITAGHFIDTSTGGYLSSAGVWTDASDRALKHGFRPLDKRSVLEQVARMPITSWSYKAEQPSVRHIGPMAQDFYSAFGLGLDDKHIGTIDEGGVALAAIQGLYRENQQLKRKNAALSARLTRLERTVASLGHGRSQTVVKSSDVISNIP
jgi:hypothetical protein